MANTCYYIAKAIGGKEAVEEFARILAREGEFENDGLGRAFDFEAEPAEPTGAKGIWTIEGQGDCAWSVASNMLKEGLDYGRPIRSLESETARLHIAVELYSSEIDIGFQEHVLVVDGQVIENECVDYEDHFLENGAADLAAFNEEHGTDYTEDDINHDGEITAGGFGEDFGRFSLIEGMERDYELLRDLPALHEGKVQVSRQRDGSVSFFFAGTAINGKAGFIQDGDQQGFTLTELSGDQVAFGSWDDVSEKLLPLYAMEVAKHVPVEKVQQALAHDRDQSLEEMKIDAKAGMVEKNALRPSKAKQPKAPEPER